MVVLNIYYISLLLWLLSGITYRWLTPSERCQRGSTHISNTSCSYFYIYIYCLCLLFFHINYIFTEGINTHMSYTSCTNCSFISKTFLQMGSTSTYHRIYMIYNISYIMIYHINHKIIKLYTISCKTKN